MSKCETASYAVIQDLENKIKARFMLFLFPDHKKLRRKVIQTANSLSSFSSNWEL